METTHVLILLASVFVLFAAVYFTARNEIVKLRLACPQKSQAAEVVLKRRVEGRKKPVRIVSCSLLADPTHVDCGQDCIKNTP